MPLGREMNSGQAKVRDAHFDVDANEPETGVCREEAHPPWPPLQRKPASKCPEHSADAQSLWGTASPFTQGTIVSPGTKG